MFVILGAAAVAAESTYTSLNLSNLPFAAGEHFDNLDSYLAFRAELGTMDHPYYERVGPDRYQLIEGRATATRPPKYFTREQLLRQFGFEE